MADRLVSPRTGLHVLGILVVGTSLGLAWNELGSPARKRIELGRQYFPASQLESERRDLPAAGSAVETDAGANGAVVTPPDVRPPATAEGAPPTPAPTDPPSPMDALAMLGISRMSLADCRDLLGSDFAVFVDARKLEDYVEGHIRGAVHLHHYTSSAQIDGVRPILEASPVVIVYCNGGDCEDSINLAVDLVSLYGIPSGSVNVFEAGFEAWKEAELPIATGEERGG
jgi:rhodanese-related sulfurtransferase